MSTHTQKIPKEILIGALPRIAPTRTTNQQPKYAPKAIQYAQNEMLLNNKQGTTNTGKIDEAIKHYV